MRTPSRPRPRFRLPSTIPALILFVAALGQVCAQALPEAASEALSRGQRAASEAVVTYSRHSPDQPLWVEALAAGNAAAQAAPDHPAPQRFLAQAYLQVGWYARSWAAWQRYLELGGAIDASVERQFVDVALWMGVNAYDSGRTEEALPYLRSVLDIDPGVLSANARLARYYLDQGDAGAAAPYVEAADGRLPDLEARLERLQWADVVGADAADAYVRGLEAREDGSLAAALDRFREAAGFHSTFQEAWRAAGEVALELGRLNEAESYFSNLLELAPDDDEALAALARIAFAQEDYATAVQRYERAVAAAPERSDLRASLGQSEQMLQARERQEALEEEAERAAAEAAAAAAAARAEEQARAAAAAEAARAEAERLAALERAAEEQAAQEQAAQEQAAQEQAAQEQAAREQAAQEQAAQEQAAQEQAAQEQAAQEQAAQEQAAQEQAAQEQAAQEQAAQEQAAQEQAAQEQAPGEAATQEGAAAESETDEAADAAGELPAQLVDATARHGGSTSGAVVFLDAPGLSRDLRSLTDATLEVRVQVMQKPSDAPVQYQVCLVPADIAVRPACTSPGLLSLTSTGAYEARQDWSSLEGFAGVAWEGGVDAVMLVARRDDGTPLSDPADDGAGEEGEAGVEEYLPMETRVRLRAVPDR